MPVGGKLKLKGGQTLGGKVKQKKKSKKAQEGDADAAPLTAAAGGPPFADGKLPTTVPQGLAYEQVCDDALLL